MSRPTAVSFDIDGTLETGDPAGPIRLAHVRWALTRGLVIGSCSDRTPREQSAMWAAARIVPDFVSRKHELARVRVVYPNHHCLHVGDTDVDRHAAEQAGFEYVDVRDLGLPWFRRQVAQL